MHDRRGHKIPVTFIACALLALLSTADAAQGQTNYTFTRIANTSGTSVYCVGMNNVGTVIAVFQQFAPGVLPELWRGNGQTPFTQIAPNVNGLCASINDLDEVAYVAYNPSNSVASLVRDFNGSLTTIATSNGVPFLAPGRTYLPSVSSNGNVLYQASGPCVAVGDGIYVSPSTTVYLCTEGTLDTGTAYAASMNDNLVAAFTARSTADGKTGVFRGSSTPLVADGAVLGPGAAVINNSGTVAFVGTVNGQYAVYTTSDGSAFSPASAIDDPGIAAPISINDPGQVAFIGGDGNGGGAIFVGPDLVLDKVIGSGDALDGSTVAQVRLWPEGLNNVGQVAFFARLADGREGVYRAEPPDTEPPTVTAPGSVTVTATEPGGARGTSSATLSTFLVGGSAVDNVDAAPQRLQPQINGIDADDATLFPLGTTTVTFRFQDVSGNIGTATSTVEVTSSNVCAADVTSQLVFSDGRTQLNKRTGTYLLRVRMSVANSGPAAITGPVSFVLDQLPLGVVLLNQAGTTGCVSPVGSPYVAVNIGADNVWTRKERLTVDLEFSSPSPSISFTRRILAGSGAR